MFQFIDLTLTHLIIELKFAFNLFLSKDEAFSSEKSRLAQITNKCSDEDIDYYVREAADILGIMHNIPPVTTSGGSPPSGSPGSQNTLAKKILEYVLAHIIEFKKLNQVQMII